MKYLLPALLPLLFTGCATTDPDFNRRLTESLNEMNNNPYIQQQRARQMQPMPAPQLPTRCVSRRVYNQVETICQ